MIQSMQCLLITVFNEFFSICISEVAPNPLQCRCQLSRDKMLAGAATSDERVVMKRRAREAAEQAYERDIEMRVKVRFYFMDFR